MQGGSKTAGGTAPKEMEGADGDRLEGDREKAAATEEEAAEAADPELTGSDSEPEADTPEGTAGDTGEEASLGEIGSSGAEWSGVERSGAEPPAVLLPPCIGPESAASQ